MYRGINEFKRCYQPTRNLVRDENGNVLAGRTTLLLNVHSVRDVRQTGIHTAEPLVPDCSPSEVGTAVSEFNRYKTQSTDPLPAQMIQTGGETLRTEIHELTTSIWIRTNCLMS
jgi:hypothetical protein